MSTLGFCTCNKIGHLCRLSQTVWKETFSSAISATFRSIAFLEHGVIHDSLVDFKSGVSCGQRVFLMKSRQCSLLLHHFGHVTKFTSQQIMITFPNKSLIQWTVDVDLGPSLTKSVLAISINTNSKTDRLELHSLHGLDYKILYLAPFLPQNILL